MYSCPWCSQGRFSFWDKQTLGPARTLTCKCCKRPVSVCWNRAQIAAIPVVALAFLGLIAGKILFMTWPAILLGGWLGISAGMLITAPLYHWYVPLEKATD